ncbi:MAG: uracil-DNA glycosylase [Paracoccus sp. (in: a-proteobacteria)]|nr:uracil-DNA glycosylase [Paracoccus sp. (in: a-proteobacteria)]
MESAQSWNDVALDGATALALLEWQREMGADEPMLDAALDRFDLAQAAPKQAAPAPAPPEPEPAPALASQTALLDEARALAAAAATLDDLADAQRGFAGLELRQGARNFVFSDGKPGARLMILGEAPGEEEDRQGKPFVGRAGQLLNQMLAAIGIARDAPWAEQAAYIANVLCWHPPGNRRPTPEEIALSRPFIARHVELAAPDILVLMGNTSCAAALDQEGILRLRGNWTTAFGLPAMPMTHPAYLLRNPPAKREAWADLLEIAARLERPPL